jgi:hypothetical protein
MQFSEYLQINAVYKSIDSLLKNEMDVLVAPFRYEFPDFYHEYTNARIIVGYTGRGKAKKEEDEAAEADAV